MKKIKNILYYSTTIIIALFCILYIPLLGMITNYYEEAFKSRKINMLSPYYQINGTMYEIERFIIIPLIIIRIIIRLLDKERKPIIERVIFIFLLVIVFFLHAFTAYA